MRYVLMDSHFCIVGLQLAALLEKVVKPFGRVLAGGSTPLQ